MAFFLTYHGGLREMEKPARAVLVALLFSIPAVLLGQNSSSPAAGGRIPVGLILDTGTLVGKICRTSISMAIDDFYAEHANYTTRLVLHTRDANRDVVGAADAAIDLLKNSEVQAILGPQQSSQAIFVSDLGQKTQVPIVSFSATSPSLSSVGESYFIRTALNDASQVNAIASIVKAFGWREVVLVYEDSEYGKGIIPYLADALQSIDARVPYRSIIRLSATDDGIFKELYKLMTMQTRVFIVHMSKPIGTRVFSKVQEAGMMSKGYAWILTDGLTSLLDSFEPSVMENIQGVLGVTPYIPKSSNLDKFVLRWKRKFRQENPDVEKPEFNIFGLWAYNAVWALAMAGEKVGTANFGFQKPQVSNHSSDLQNLGVSNTGPDLLKAILELKFSALGGEVHLRDGQLQSSTYQIVNVIGKGEREVGFWTPEYGIMRQLKPTARKYSTSKAELASIFWPGDLTSTPKGWEIPTSEKKLRVGVPVKDGFYEFVNVNRHPVTNSTTVSGYCIDIFDSVMQMLPYAVPYEYIPFENAEGQSAGSYDDLVNQVVLQEYDALAGDVTIIANRSLYVDFTLPYTESGVSLLVSVKEGKHNDVWIFLKPLTIDLWLWSLAFFIFTGFVVWVIEHQINEEEFGGQASQQLGIIFYFIFSTLVFAHKENLKSNLSRVVVIIWVFVVLILTSSYTASLTSMLTVQQLQPTVTDVNQLLRSGDYVGYHRDSFVVELLKELRFDESKLIPLGGPDEYVEALSKGSQNGGVAAVFHEIPYIKLFLAQHCTGYTMIGPMYKTAGFGFVFPKGSPLVVDVSKAVLNITQGDKMTRIENKWIGNKSICQNIESSINSKSLNFRRFGGLFLITGITSVSSLFLFFTKFIYLNWDELKHNASEHSLRQSVTTWFRHFQQRNSTSFKRDVPFTPVVGENEVLPDAEGSQSPASTSISDMSYSPEIDNQRTSSPWHSIEITRIRN